jgi:acetylornithine deacetylase/succinyl-diaminopimelate desuccinylase-like protein
VSARRRPLALAFLAALSGAAVFDDALAQTAPGAAYVVTSAAPAGFDRALAQKAALEHLRRLIGINTQNPPGNELKTAQYFDSVFAAMPGVERHVLESGNGRANFVARLRATRPTKRPVLIMGHMDVVNVDSTKWITPAFTATLRDEDGLSYLYGRGAIDDKGMLATATAAMQQLALQRDRLDRDIIFLATAAEEGGPEVGIDLMIEKHFDLIKDAEFALNEGGRVRVADGRVKTVNIQTTEKVSYNVVATAKGTSGHASVPLPDNVLAALARAVSRVDAWKAPVKLNETTRLYFERLSRIEPNAAFKTAMIAVSRPRRVGGADQRCGGGAVERTAAQRRAPHRTLADADERRHSQQRHSIGSIGDVQHACVAQRRCERDRRGVQPRGCREAGDLRAHR